MGILTEAQQRALDNPVDDLSRKTRPTVEEMRAIMDRVDAGAVADEIVLEFRTAGGVADAHEDNEANRTLERDVAIDNLLDIIKRQSGLAGSTLKTAWAKREFTRIADDVFADPLGEIKLGHQALGSGLSERALELRVGDTVKRVEGLTAQEVSNALAGATRSSDQTAGSDHDAGETGGS